jgi:small-conductance mechanosensitive channel
VTIDQIEAWHLLAVVGGHLATFILTTAGLILKVRNADQRREDARQKSANAQFQELADKIQRGDEQAREKASQQIEGVRQEVTEMRVRVDKVEREVAAMPTREQLDRGFSDIREAIHALSQRVDLINDRRHPAE